MGNIMSVESKAKLLDVIRREPLGVRETAKRFRKRPETTISLIREMEDEGLLETSSQRTRKKGRPKKVLKPTILGMDYLKTFHRLRSKTLRAGRNDLEKARRDAEYVNRLIARGIDPYQAFMELNEIVRAG